MPAAFPEPGTRNPVLLPDGSGHAGTVFLKGAIAHPRWVLGDYSYASADDPPDDWAARLAPYLYAFSPETLTIGKFCQLAHGVEFITASANHRHDGFSSFPFAIFDGGAADGRPSIPGPGPDTVIGHDVWLGRDVKVMPGAQIGTGAIVAAGAVVVGTVPPYTIMGGNPARPLRPRFDAATVARLLEIAWWDWPIGHILAHEAAICGADLAALEAAGEALKA